jgi:hypothetical protein
MFVASVFFYFRRPWGVVNGDDIDADRNLDLPLNHSLFRLVWCAFVVVSDLNIARVGSFDIQIQ